MASTINEIIKESIEKIRADHLSLTPDNYSQVFCEVAKRKGVVVEDCQKVAKYINKLDTRLSAEAKKINVSTIDQLLAFFVARLNKSNAAESEQLIAASSLLLKRVLQAVTLLHNKRATNLANASLDKLESKQNVKSMEIIKDKWFEFISDYDDTFLKKLDKFGKINKEDVEKMVFDINKILSKDEDSEIYKVVAPLIVATLTPSIASSMNDDLATISYELRNSPQAISSPAMQDEIKQFIKKRIELDKEEVKNKISTLDKILDEINKKIFDLIDSTNMSSEEVQNIKKDLNDINFSKDGFESIHNRLINIANSLENESKGLSLKMGENQKTIAKLHTRVKKLENALLIAKQESKEDFLTNVATKRALEKELKRVEEAYIRYKIDYTICFLDIDHFKVVNDTYGHEAGDLILSTLGKILRKYVRQADFVGRYGGEEFLAILPGVDLNQGSLFADKIRKIIENYKFIYKNERIDIKISCGIAQRANSASGKEVISNADKMLYKAKEGGRNQVMPNPK
ncbi:GGDEF domain-containing protein [Sulfurospirillum arcachonense]|uniref:GGDEF domain-containing protein n=1 Tax=Sulfurospirillum arcachonense TaxID=57666 RepID=UPI00046AA38F|nr:GGDEF domain-containing protein [Sulfurospirillum arcachonense]